MCGGARETQQAHTRRCLPFDTSMHVPSAWSTRVAACRRGVGAGVVQVVRRMRDKNNEAKNREIELCKVLQGGT